MNKVESKVARVEKAVNDFGGLVHEFRTGNNLSLQSMAELVSLSTSYLWRIENAKRKPDLDVRVRILTLGMTWSTEDIYFYLEQMISRDSIKCEPCH